jgi:hypothetical protein
MWRRSTFLSRTQQGAIAGDVCGLIELPDGDGTFAATSVTVTSAPAAFTYFTPTFNWVGDGGGAPASSFNSFTVTGGSITDLSFFGLFNDSTALGLSNDEDDGSSSLDLLDAVNFGATGVRDADSSTLSTSALAPIPLPAGMVLLLGGLGMIGVVRRRAAA